MRKRNNENKEKNLKEDKKGIRSNREGGGLLLLCPTPFTFCFSFILFPSFPLYSSFFSSSSFSSPSLSKKENDKEKQKIK